MEKRLVLLLTLVILLAYALAICPYSRAQPQTPTLTYDIEVLPCGNATVTITFDAGGFGKSFLYLPRQEHWRIVAVKGAFKWIKHSPSFNPFYTNSSFEYAAKNGLFELKIRYTFPYATLMVGDKAWFMSPLLGAPNPVKVVVRVKLPNLAVIEGCSPLPTYRHGNVLGFTLTGTSQGARVAVNYKLRNPVPDTTWTRVINGSVISVKAAVYYGSFAEKILYVFSKAAPYLVRVFGPLPPRVEFQFFLPKQQRITALGYVLGEDINVGGKGPIHLNLALIRFVEGYIEATVIHEYVHIALGRAGVIANNKLRWFHEGVAMYVSLQICKLIGVNTTYLEKDRAEAMEKLVKERGYDLGFVQNWQSGPLEYQYYMASEYIITTLADKYGGLNFIKKVVTVIRSRGGVSNNAALVDALSKAAGRDLRPLFEKWGFNLPQESVVPGLELLEKKLLSRWWVPVLTALVMAIVLVAAFALILKRLREEEKYVEAPPVERTIEEIPTVGLKSPLTRLEELYRQGMISKEAYEELKKWFEEREEY